MTTLPFFPVLAGQGWSTHKTPVFSTLVASHVSGREVRDALYANPIWRFELTFNALDGTSNGNYGGVGLSSFQSLLGLYLRSQGQFGEFVYCDPTDYSVNGQTFGVGDGATTTFQLTRSLGGFSEPIVQPLAPSTPTLFPVQGLVETFVPNNLLNYSGDLTNAVWTKAGTSVAGGIADPFGGAGAQTVTATSSSSSVYQTQVATGGNYVSAFWVRRRSGSGTVTLADPANDTSSLTLAVTPTWQRFWVSGPPAAGDAHSAITLSTSGDAIDVYGAQLEQSSVSTPGAYFQTLATSYFGGPWISAGGALVDPSAYTISNGAVTFATAPLSGATIAWTGYFGFLCRFESDDLDFEQFMANLWRADSVKFRSLRNQ
jgi:hypothetical protein